MFRLRHICYNVLVARSTLTYGFATWSSHFISSTDHPRTECHVVRGAMIPKWTAGLRATLRMRWIEFVPFFALAFCSLYVESWGWGLAQASRWWYTRVAEALDKWVCVHLKERPWLQHCI